MIVNRLELLKKLPAYRNEKKLIIDNQETHDIIKEILVSHKKFAKDYDKISSFFWRGNLKDTARGIFDFLKGNVKYSIEPDFHQSVKSPAAIVATGIFGDGQNDCKHYSQFIGGILDSLKRKNHNIDWFYRFANYRILSTNPGHVFVVVKDRSGNEIWIDPVLQYFDDHKPFINCIDKKINTMALYQISGFDEVGAMNTVDGIGKRRKKGRLFMKIHMAPSRGAYLLMVRVNLFGMAKRLHKVMMKNEAGLKKLWEKLGGKYSVLKKTVMKALRKKGVRGMGDVYEHPYSINGTIGVAPLAAALAAAVPVITAMAALVGKIKGGSDNKDVLESAKDAAQEIATAAGGGKITLPDFGAEHEKLDKKEGIVDPPDTSGGPGANDAKQGGGSSFSMNPKTMLLIGGAGVAALLILKKK